jgi:hypothetical protein
MILYMSDETENLLARLAGAHEAGAGSDPWAAVAATLPDHDSAGQKDEKIEPLLERIRQLAKSRHAAAERSATTHPAAPREDVFVPREPESFEEAALTDTEVESLILKYLLARGEASGREIADQVKLPFVVVDQLLREVKNQQLLYHRGAAPMNDFIYLLTDLGRERAHRYRQLCTYFGAAPVSIEDYVHSVHAQSLTRQHPTVEDLHRAFTDLLLNKEMLDRLGPAINSGRGLFLFGAPGNGKTSIAERVTATFGQEIWIPRSLGIGGVIIRSAIRNFPCR